MALPFIVSYNFGKFLLQNHEKIFRTYDTTYCMNYDIQTANLRLSLNQYEIYCDTLYQHTKRNSLLARHAA